MRQVKTEDEVANHLTLNPSARERKNKNRFIASLLIDKHHLDISLDKLTTVITQAATYDRSWRKVLEENPHLRGKDYDQKVILEQQAQLELGYTPHYSEDLKKLKTLEWVQKTGY